MERKYTMDIIEELCSKDKKVDEDVNLVFSYLLNECNIIKNVAIVNLTTTYVQEEINKAYDTPIRSGHLLHGFERLMKMNYIEVINTGDTFSVILTKLFYDKFIDEYEVDESDLPEGYEDIESVINQIKSSVKPKEIKKVSEDDIPPSLKYYNASIKKRQEEAQKRRKKLVKFSNEFIRKNLRNTNK